jgi:signal transduction histidine kinase
VDVAENGDEGLSKIQAKGYDLVLLDVMMPDISGLDLLTLIHEHDPDLVCIIITGYATVPMAVNTIKQGAYDFLTKPFTADDLLLAVNQGVERRKLLLESKRLRAVEAEAQKLALEKAKLEELDRAKVAFIRLVTHELQAPIAAIQSYLELILSGYVPPPLAGKQREMLEKAMARAQEQLALLADLLEFGRLREVKTIVQPTRVRVEEVLRKVVEQFEEQVAQKSLHLGVEIAPDLSPVRAVPDQIRSVWTNLIGNAIRYTPPGGTVAISLRRDDGQVIGQVRDTGIGIAAEAQPRLFTEFFRADNAKSFAPQGTGLGLAIVKQIVEGSGGRIWVQSELGHGSTFTFVLPVATDTADSTLPHPLST